MQRIEIRWAGHNGGLRFLEVMVVRVPVRGLGAAILIHDRSEDHAAREREHAQREHLAHAGRVSLVGQFASAIAHELGQPLTACQSYAAGIEHRLSEALAEDPEAREALRLVQRHLEQAGAIISNIRFFVRRDHVSGETVAVADLVAQTTDLLRMSLQSVQVRFDRQPALDGLKVRGNRVELQQVLVNLILNAVEAMRDGQTPSPELEIRITAPRRCVGLSVIDNGPGVPAVDADDIFEPFKTTKKNGLGMGLIMCRTIVEAHGGTLSLRLSRRRGARFDITLPSAG